MDMTVIFDISLSLSLSLPQSWFLSSSEGELSQSNRRHWIHPSRQQRAADLPTFRELQRRASRLHDLEANGKEHHEEGLPRNTLLEGTLFLSLIERSSRVRFSGVIRGLFPKGDEPLVNLAGRADLSNGFSKGNNAGSYVQPKGADKVSGLVLNKGQPFCPLLRGCPLRGG